ncbi:MAG: DUF748 domain-containing protein, partial [bacterium]
PQADLTASNLDVDLSNLHWPLREKIPLHLRTNIGDAGLLRAHGSIFGDTRTVTTDFSLEEFSLTDTNDYLRNVLQGRWKSGQFGIRGSIKASASPLEISFRGQSAIRDSLLVNSDGDTLSGWKKTSFESITLEWSRRQFQVGPIDIEGAYLDLKIDENYRTNLGDLLIPQPEAIDEALEVENKPWAVSIGPIRVTSASLDFTDENVPGTFQANIRDLNGLIDQVRTTSSDTAGLSLDGTLGDQSTVRLNGSVRPFSFSSYSTIMMKIENVGLPTLTPYSSKLLGYKIDRGKLLTTFEYRIEDGELTGENHAVLKELTLGDYVGNAIIGIPMRLAVALLKDSNGVITLDVPVSGNLNSPSFDFTRVIYQSVRSLLINIVKSPFSFLAGLVNTEPEQLKYVEFEPTEGQLTERARSGLKKLATIMEKRPLVKVGIRPGWTENDRRTLARKSVDEYLSSNGGNPGDPTESIELLERRLTEITSQEELLDLRAKHSSEEGKITDAAGSDTYARKLYQLNLDKTTVSTRQLRGLAQERAATIRKFLREQQVPPERIFVLDPTELDSDRTGATIRLPLTVKG